jgi:hypothetical protein
MLLISRSNLSEVRTLTDVECIIEVSLGVFTLSKYLRYKRKVLEFFPPATNRFRGL